LKPLEGATRVVWKFFGFKADQDERILVADKKKWRAVTCNQRLNYLELLRYLSRIITDQYDEKDGWIL